MKSKLVYDMFMFYNEWELLELRLNILNDYVDKFIIVESNETYMGKPKPLIFMSGIDRYAKWKDKIIYHTVTDFPNDSELLAQAKRSPNVGAGEHWWVREFYQRESQIKTLGMLNDEDIIFISDLDEIWNPEVIKDIEVKDDEVYRPVQKSYFYYLNNRSSQDIGAWTGTRFAKFKTLKKYGINHFRTEREVKGILIDNGGWHFTLLGFDVERIKDHIQQTGHTEYNRPDVIANLDNSLKAKRDFLNRGVTMWRDDSGLPKFIEANKEKYKHLFTE